MIGKPVTIGRTVVALPDLISDSEGKTLDEAVEKIISIHKHKEIKKSGFSSGQGYANICSTWRHKVDSCAFGACCWQKSHET